MLKDDNNSERTHGDQLKWWQQQRFGMFIHWGPVSLKGEEIGWSRGREIPKADYDSLHNQFAPARFDPNDWVEIAKDAGMKYIVFTTKHHDGFCEFDTALTRHKVTGPECPFGRDVTRELGEACRRSGLGWGLYYSPTDWYVEDNPGTVAPLDLGTYYCDQVVKELLTNYGRIDTVWFDLEPIPGVDGQSLLERMRQKQPWVLVNNRGNIGALGDYGTPEQIIGDYDPVNPWESCMTIQASNQWAWDPDGGVKPIKQLVDMVVDSACGGGNCLLNVGPRPDGVIDPEMVAPLQEIGKFMRACGESIYGTVAGPIARSPSWGGTTRRGNHIYLHLNQGFAGKVTLPPILPSYGTIVSSIALTGGTPTVSQSADGITVSLPPKNIHPLDTVIRLQMDPATHSAHAPAPLP
jgi:alpha-L-fucosidase